VVWRIAAKQAKADERLESYADLPAPRAPIRPTCLTCPTCPTCLTLFY
jgi:hypothetical protein